MEYVKSYIRVFGFIAFEGDSGARTWCIDFCLLPKCLTKKIQGSLHPRNSNQNRRFTIFPTQKPFWVYPFVTTWKKNQPLLGGSQVSYCKWLGSPPFISHETAICKGSHNPILRGTYVTNHGLLTTYPSVMGPDHDHPGWWSFFWTS